MSSSTPSNGNRRTSRGGGRGGRSRGGGRGGGEGGGGSSHHQYNNNMPRRGGGGGRGRSNYNNNNHSRYAASEGAVSAGDDDMANSSFASMRDEDVLIAFMPFLRNEDNEARMIHEQYRISQDQNAFLRLARDFLQRQNDNRSSANSTPQASNTSTLQPQQPTTTTSSSTEQPTPAPPPVTQPQIAPSIQPPPAITEQISQPSAHPPSVTTAPSPQQLHSDQDRAVAFPTTSSLSSESPMKNLLVEDDPVIQVLHSNSIANSSPTSLRPPTLPIGSKSPSHVHAQQALGASSPFPIIGSSASVSANGSPSVPPKPLFPMTPPRHHGATPPNPVISPPMVSPSVTSNLLLAITSASSSSSSSWLPTSSENASIPLAISAPTTPATEAPPPTTSNLNVDLSYPQDNHNNNNNLSKNTPHATSLVATPATPAMIMESTKAAAATSTIATTPAAPATAAPTKRDFGPPKRLWMHFEEQPGRLLANEVPANLGQVLDLRPRQELTAKWMLPIAYLQQRSRDSHQITNASSLRDALYSLTVGLFRRGCTENGQNVSIISKQILASPGESRSDYPFQVQGNVVIGTVPFYAPRTPGHVVFRLYWQDDPVYTLATGPTLNVRVTAEDLDPTLRFILSNFKGKKVNPTSLSSLHALALVMEQIHVPQHGSSSPHHQQQQQHHHSHHQQQQQQHYLENAGRALWGCICEARKVVDACALEHEKTSLKLVALEQDVEALKTEIAQTVQSQAQSEDIAMAVAVAAVMDDTDPLDDLAAAMADHDFMDATATTTTAAAAVTTDHLLHHHQQLAHMTAEECEEDPAAASATAKLREKTRTLLSGRASSERKWRDSQLAFAGILKAAVTNPSISYLLRRELIAKMRLEYDLWCPLCEEFAVPKILVSGDANGIKGSNQHDNREVSGGDSPVLWYRPLNEIPHSAVTSEHFQLCRQQRALMQVELLGFDPNMLRLEEILFPKAATTPTTNRRNSPNHGDNRTTTATIMDAAAVNVFNQLSAAMGHLYQEEYTTADFVHQQREIIRSQTEKFVALCDRFPPGTKVAIFGSSANGFGSQQSDLDMCLQLPPGTKLADEEDASGSLAMAKLADILKEGGMQDVDTVRLTARIPVIRFNCAKPLRNGQESEFLECDLSMHNPLAVLNTSLLRTYADINPVTRVLAAIIKRWAKARDINDPSRHTLSSYGYIIMLLHFLTYHQRTGNGLVAPVAGPQGKPLRQHRQATPLLPNLQWMDNMWPQSAPGTPYRELSSLPTNVRLPHPIEESASVNAYFYRPSEPSQFAALQRLFPGQDLSLAILLCSFFRYYAYEFDFKHFVVSLHSTASRGLVEREAKAETDGWRNYSAALTIEDPFETFYDIAHVLRGGYYHRIRREFALAYTKIADAASGRVPMAAGATATPWHDKGDLRSMTGLDLIHWICEPIAVADDAEKL